MQQPHRLGSMHRGNPSSWIIEGMLWGIAVLATISVLLFALFVATFDPLGRSEELHRGDAAAFHQAESTQFIKLPQVATVKEVKKVSVWVDENYDILFHLPPSQSPDDWVRQIWAANKFKSGAREGFAHYSEYHDNKLHHGHRSLEYLHEKDLYLARIGTD